MVRDERRMTFIVIPHGQKDLSTRSYEISYRRLRVALWGAIGVGALLFLMAVSWVWMAAQSARIPGMNAEIRRLQGEVAQVEQLKRTLIRMEARYEQISTMLGGGTRVDTSAVRDTSRAGDDQDAPVDSAAGADSTTALRPTGWPLLARGFVTRGHLAALGPRHPGIDIAVASGSRVVASGSGVVLEAGEDSVYGRYVRIAHPDGYESWYGHASRVLVAPRERVEARQVIALSGSSGVSTAPHLHFEIRKDGSPVDPRRLLQQPEQEQDGVWKEE